MACKREKDPPLEGPQKDIGMLITIKVCEHVDFYYFLFSFFFFFYDSIAVFLYTINYLLLFTTFPPPPSFFRNYLMRMFL